MKKNKTMIFLFILPTILTLLITYVYPVIRTVVMSFFKVESLTSTMKTNVRTITTIWNMYGKPPFLLLL